MEKRATELVALPPMGLPSVAEGLKKTGDRSLRRARYFVLVLLLSLLCAVPYVWLKLDRKNPEGLIAFLSILVAALALAVTEITLHRAIRTLSESLNGIGDATRKLNNGVDLLESSSSAIESNTGNLNNSVESLRRGIVSLQTQITNLEDATRRVLDGFDDIFPRALWLLSQARDEIWYVNFLYGFGLPHTCSQEVKQGYPAKARVLGVNEDLDKAVQEFSRVLADKMQSVPKFTSLVLQENALEERCLARLKKKRPGYDSLDVEMVLSKEKKLRDAISRTIWDNRGIRELPVEGFKLHELERLPLQFLITRIAGRNLEGAKWGCLVFLIGTENMDSKSAKGFYTELADVVDVYKELARGLVPDA